MSWKSYNQNIVRYPQFGFSLDLSLMDISEDFNASMEPKVQKAFADIKAIESGAIANPDEGRMVGHYWLRNADLAPSPEIKKSITEPLADLKDFAVKVHSGEVAPPSGGSYQLRRELCGDTFLAEDGWIRASDEPGLGIHVNEEVFEKYYPKSM